MPTPRPPSVPLEISGDLGRLLVLGVILIGTGVVAGIVAGLLGVGGGIVIVPVLFNLLLLAGVEPAVVMHLAVGTSLATIVPTSIASARAHWRRGNLDPLLLRQLGPAIVLGVIPAAAFGGYLSGDVLKGVFGCVAMLVALNMAARRQVTVLVPGLPAGLPRHAIGFVIGGFSTLMGIGGGTLSVPILSAFGVPLLRAVGTASAIGLLISVPGALGFIATGIGAPGLPPGTLGYVSLLGFALIVPASVLAAPLGARIASSIDTRWLRLAFAVFLFVTALRMLFDVIA